MTLKKNALPPKSEKKAREIALEMQGRTLTLDDARCIVRLRDRVKELKAELEAARAIRQPLIGGRVARPMMSYPLAGTAKWYSIKQAAESAEVLLYDEIGIGGIGAKQFAEDFGAITARKITLRINSAGGDVFDGFAIFEAIRRHPGTVNVVIDGLAASIASIIALAGKTTTISTNGYMMIHNPWVRTTGDAATLRKQAELLDKLTRTSAEVYAKKTGTKATAWLETMNEETWYNATEAKAAGLVDSIVDGGDAALSPAVAKAILSRFNPPAALRRAAASIVGTSSGTTDPALDEFTKREAEAVRQWKDSPAQRELRRFTESEKLALAEHEMLNRK